MQQDLAQDFAGKDLSLVTFGGRAHKKLTVQSGLSTAISENRKRW